MKFLLFVSFLVISVNEFHAADETLRLVHVFFRHGSRTPELKDVYPTDPYNETTFYPLGFGALTNEGKRASFKLGQLLRNRYDSFLGSLYIPEAVEATSTDFDRTKSTLLLVLAGLYPPSSLQSWNQSFPWQPIPYHYDKDALDFKLRRPSAYCPTYAKELAKVLSSDDVLRDLKSYRDLFTYVEKKTKKPINQLIDIFSVFQTLTAERTMNLTLPNWTETVYPREIHEVASKQCYYENYNAILKRLNGGRMLSKVVDHMKTPQTGRKIYLYSGHENNVINILAALNLFKPHVPNYTAAVMVELHAVDGLQEYGVKVLYLRDVNERPEIMKLEGCEAVCPLSSFIRITEPHVPVNYTAECHSHVNLD